MSTILYQIIIALNLLLGSGDVKQSDASKQADVTKQAQQIYDTKSYSVTDCGVVIIDTDEL